MKRYSAYKLDRKPASFDDVASTCSFTLLSRYMKDKNAYAIVMVLMLINIGTVGQDFEQFACDVLNEQEDALE